MYKVVILLVCAFTFSCSADTPENEPVSKDQFGTKSDSSLEERVCREAGEPSGCDVCEVQGWYNDNNCDTFCAQPDPDCDTEPSNNVVDPSVADCESREEDIGKCVDDSLDATVAGCLPEVGTDSYGETYGCCTRFDFEFCGELPEIDETYCSDLIESVSKCIDDSLDATLESCSPVNVEVENLAACCDIEFALFCGDL